VRAAFAVTAAAALLFRRKEKAEIKAKPDEKN
jgi:hypothetical protein